MKIKVEESLCTGCKSCELACSATRSGEFNPARSRLRIENTSLLGISKINICQKCEKPLCIEACVFNALSKELESGVISLDAQNCVSCFACATACPFHAVYIDPVNKLPLICDSCGDDPICVKFCHHQALVLV